MDGTPVASIIVPLVGSPIQAMRCFEGIAAQADDPLYEVIVVDDASVSLEPVLARLQGDVEVIRSARRVGFYAAVRLAAEHARGEIVVLVRDAAVPQREWLQPLTAALGDPAVGLASSTTLGESHTSPLEAWALAARREELLADGAPSASEQLAFAQLALSAAERGRRVIPVRASVISPPGARTAGARGAPGQTPELTIVIPTLDAASERLRACVAAVQAATATHPHEIVIVDNGCPPQGFSAPVNAGLRAARTPYVVVMNDDVEPLEDWWAPLRAALDAGAAVVFPLTVDGPMRRDFAAWCFAMGSESVARFAHAPGEFFDPSLVVWYQDTDLLHRLRQADLAPVLVERSRIRHGLSETVASEDPELSAWIGTQILSDRELFLAKHPDAVLEGHALAAT
jgi:GT2 family glycosyltransferase